MQPKPFSLNRAAVVKKIRVSPSPRRRAAGFALRTADQESAREKRCYIDLSLSEDSGYYKTRSRNNLRVERQPNTRLGTTAIDAMDRSSDATSSTAPPPNAVAEAQSFAEKFSQEAAGRFRTRPSRPLRETPHGKRSVNRFSLQKGHFR